MWVIFIIIFIVAALAALIVILAASKVYFQIEKEARKLEAEKELIEKSIEKIKGEMI